MPSGSLFTEREIGALFALRDCAKLTFAEISKYLNRSVSAVQARYQKGLNNQVYVRSSTVDIPEETLDNIQRQMTDRNLKLREVMQLEDIQCSYSTLYKRLSKRNASNANNLQSNPTKKPRILPNNNENMISHHQIMTQSLQSHPNINELPKLIEDIENEEADGEEEEEEEVQVIPNFATNHTSTSAHPINSDLSSTNY